MYTRYTESTLYVCILHRYLEIDLAGSWLIIEMPNHSIHEFSKNKILTFFKVFNNLDKSGNKKKWRIQIKLSLNYDFRVYPYHGCGGGGRGFTDPPPCSFSYGAPNTRCSYHKKLFWLFLDIFRGHYTAFSKKS